MKILLSADFHSDFSRLTLLANKVDLCICCGDIFDYHQIPSNEFKFPVPFFSIKGNKEHWGGKKLEKNLENFANFFWLNKHLDKLEDLTGLLFYGIDFIKEPSVIPDNVDVLVSHQPAFGIADQCSDPFHTKMVPHCGSKHLRRLIDLHTPKYLISGHVHHYQRQENSKTLALTLPPALIDPILVLKISNRNITIQEIKI